MVIVFLYILRKVLIIALASYSVGDFSISSMRDLFERFFVMGFVTPNLTLKKSLSHIVSFEQFISDHLLRIPFFKTNHLKNLTPNYLLFNNCASNFLLICKDNLYLIAATARSAHRHMLTDKLHELVTKRAFVIFF